MNSPQPQSSFWGNVSYVGKLPDKSQVRVNMAGHEFFIQDTDPAVGFFQVGSGKKKIFVVLETIRAEGIQRVCAVYDDNADILLVRSLQDLLAEQGSLTDDDLAERSPAYKVIRSKD